MSIIRKVIVLVVMQNGRIRGTSLFLLNHLLIYILLWWPFLLLFLQNKLTPSVQFFLCRRLYYPLIILSLACIYFCCIFFTNMTRRPQYARWGQTWFIQCWKVIFRIVLYPVFAMVQCGILLWLLLCSKDLATLSAG